MKQADVSGLSCRLKPCDVLVSAAADGHVRVLSLCHHRPWSQLLPEAMLMSKGPAELALPHVWSGGGMEETQAD